MVNIVCFKWGQKFSSDYVNKLYRGIKRNTTIPINFICYTEDPVGIECKTEEFIEDLPYWWYIIGAMNPEHKLEGKTVYFDLDTVILKNIDDILQWDVRFATLQDFYRPNGLQTAYIMWDKGIGKAIWDRFVDTYPKSYWPNLIREPGGTNRFLEKSVGTKRNVPRVQGKFPNSCASYKATLLQRGDNKPNEEERIIFFHGKPMPHEVAELAWMQEHWK